MRAYAAAAVVIAILGGRAATARADDTNDRVEVVVTDVLADAIIIGGLSNESFPAAGVGLGVYALGAPISHLIHDKSSAAAWSLGLRVGAPAVLGVEITDWAVLSGSDPDADPAARMFTIGGAF